MKTEGSLMVSHRRTSCEPDSWYWMAGRTEPTSADLDGIFAGTNAFSACLPADQRAIRAVLDRNVASLGTLTLGRGVTPFPEGIVPIGRLYCVLDGKVALRWQSAADRTLTFVICSEGETFGELQCGLRDVTPASLGLSLVPVFSRNSRTSRVIELPAKVVSELLRNDGFAGRLRAQAFELLLQTLVAMSLQLQHEPALMLAHFLLSPLCGASARFHPELRYLGARITIEKTITLAELVERTGLSKNCVRKWMRALKDCGFIRTDQDSVHGTRVVVKEPSKLLATLEVRGAMTRLA